MLGMAGSNHCTLNVSAEVGGKKQNETKRQMQMQMQLQYNIYIYIYINTTIPCTTPYKKCTYLIYEGLRTP